MKLKEQGGKNEAANKEQPPKKKLEHIYSQRHKDIQYNNGINWWELPETARDVHDSPATLFELVITGKIV